MYIWIFLRNNNEKKKKNNRIHVQKRNNMCGSKESSGKTATNLFIYSVNISAIYLNGLLLLRRFNSTIQNGLIILGSCYSNTVCCIVVGVTLLCVSVSISISLCVQCTSICILCVYGVFHSSFHNIFYLSDCNLRKFCCLRPSTHSTNQQIIDKNTTKQNTHFCVSMYLWIPPRWFPFCWSSSSSSSSTPSLCRCEYRFYFLRCFIVVDSIIRSRTKINLIWKKSCVWSNECNVSANYDCRASHLLTEDTKTHILWCIQ